MEKNLLCIQELDEERQFFTVTKRRIARDFFYPLHWHNYFECEILLSGEGEHVCNGSTRYITEGDCWLMSFYDFHSLRTRSDQEMEMIHICFESDFVSAEIREVIQSGGFCCRLEGTVLKEARVLCEQMLVEQEENAPYSETSRRALLERLLVLLLRAAPHGLERASSKIATALSYMHAHFREEMTLEAVAELCGLTPNYFGTRFKAAVGASFHDYLNKIRLKYACQLLASSNLTIKEIALASGYSSVEYFFYVFKKRLSITPIEYRKNG